MRSLATPAAVSYYHDPPEGSLNTFYKNLSMWLVIGLTMILLFNLFNKPQGNSTSLTYTEFIASIQSKAINRVTISGDIPLDVAAQIMLDKRIHRLLIVQGGRTPNRPVGVLSLSDVVREMASTTEE